MTSVGANSSFISEKNSGRVIPFTLQYTIIAIVKIIDAANKF